MRPPPASGRVSASTARKGGNRCLVVSWSWSPCCWPPGWSWPAAGRGRRAVGARRAAGFDGRVRVAVAAGGTITGLGLHPGHRRRRPGGDPQPPVRGRRRHGALLPGTPAPTGPSIHGVPAAPSTGRPTSPGSAGRPGPWPRSRPRPGPCWPGTPGRRRVGRALAASASRPVRRRPVRAVDGAARARLAAFSLASGCPGRHLAPGRRRAGARPAGRAVGDPGLCRRPFTRLGGDPPAPTWARWSRHQGPSTPGSRPGSASPCTP